MEEVEGWEGGLGGDQGLTSVFVFGTEEIYENGTAALCLSSIDVLTQKDNREQELFRISTGVCAHIHTQ